VTVSLHTNNTFDFANEAVNLKLFYETGDTDSLDCSPAYQIGSTNTNPTFSGGKTIVITLSGDTWDTDIGNDNTKTGDLINGLDSAGSELLGWDKVVKFRLDYRNVSRDSATQVTITLFQRTRLPRAVIRLKANRPAACSRKPRRALIYTLPPAQLRSMPALQYVLLVGDHSVDYKDNAGGAARGL
jgi:hypothetical protein